MKEKEQTTTTGSNADESHKHSEVRYIRGYDLNSMNTNFHNRSNDTVAV